ncbi:MAG: LysR family transcriptional regulator [Lachnospiraceae bacterium]|jgi:DNA-binding transcriptional LysR family regulator
MTLQNMRYIIEIANYRSFSEAAKSLYLTQSTLSAAVRETETELGIILFNRTNRGVSLTHDGEDFLKYAKEIVEQADYLSRRYQRRDFLPTHFSVSTQRLPFAVRAFNELLNTFQLPRYDIALRESPTRMVFHDVSIGKSELGVAAFHDTHFHLIQKSLKLHNLSFVEIEQLNIYVFLRKSHPLAKHASLSLDDLKDYAFITYDQESSPSQYTEEILFYELLDKNIHVNDRCTKIALIRGNNCFSVGPDLPNSNADSFHSGLGEIVAIPLKEQLEALHVGYLYKNGQSITPMGKQYLHLLKREIQRLKIHD